MKKAIIIIACLVFLFVVVASVAPFLIDLNKYKSNLLDLVKPSVPRAIDFKKIELTILTGLGAEIQGLRIGENPAFGNGDFLTLERVDIKVKLLPLLEKQIQLRKLIMVRPVVHLIRNAKGEFNFMDLTKGSSIDKPEAADKETVKEGAKGTGGSTEALLAGVMVSDFALLKGQINFLDEMISKSPIIRKVDSLDLKLEDVSLNKPVKISLAAHLPGIVGQNVTFKGVLGPIGERLNINRLFMDIALTLKDFPVAEIRPYMPKNLPLYPENGDISLNLNLNGNMASVVTSHGEITCTKLVLAEAGGKNRTGNISVHLQEKLEIEWEKGGVEIETLEMSLNENTLSIKGRVDGVKNKPQWDLIMKSQVLKQASLIDAYPPLKRSLPSNLSISGPVDLEIVSKGNLDKLQTHGTLEMKDLEIALGDMLHKPKTVPFQVSFNASKDGDTIKLDPLSINLHTLSLRTTGDIIGLSHPNFGLLIQTNDVSPQGWGALIPRIAGYEPDGILTLRSSLKGTLDNLSLNLQLLSSRLAFQLPQKLENAKMVNVSKGSLESLDMEIQAKKTRQELKGEGKIEVKKGEFKTIPFEKMQARFDYQNNRLRIQGLQVYTLQGDISLNGYVDTRSYLLNLNPTVKDIDVAKLMDSLTEYKGLFKGTFSGAFALSSPSKTGQKGTVDANGTFRLGQGELNNFNLVETILDSLFGLKSISQFLEQRKGELQKHKSTRFDSLDGDFSVSGNQAVINKVTLHNIQTYKATDSDAILDGKVMLDTKALDLKGRLILSLKDSTNLAKQAEPLKALLTEEGRMVLPISVTGTIQKPMPFLDSQYVIGALAKYYAKKELEKGLNKLGEKLGLPKKQPKDQQKTGKPVEELLKELLRK
jgi:hypothetical protein